MCLSERSERHERIAGAAFGEHHACGGAHRRLAPDPIYESGALRRVGPFRRAKSEWLVFLLSAHWGLVPSKFVGACTLTYSAWCLPTRLVRAWSRGRRDAAPTKSRFLLCSLGGNRRADVDIGPYTRNGEPSVGAAVLSGPQSWTSCPGYAMVGGVRTARTLNRGPRQSPAKRVWWGEEEQGSDMTDAHAWASGIERTLRRRRAQWPGGKKGRPLRFCPPDASTKVSRGRPP